MPILDGMTLKPPGKRLNLVWIIGRLNHIRFVRSSRTVEVLPEILFEFIHHTGGIFCCGLHGRHSCRMVVRKPVFEREGITFTGSYSQSTITTSCLFVGHTNCSTVGGIGISITRVIEVEYFFGKVQPSLLVKVFSIVLSDHRLEFTLPGSNYFMKRLCCRSEIIRIVVTLLMEINMHMRHPPVVCFKTML